MAETDTDRPEGFEKTALERWQLAVDTTRKQLERETDDLSWQVAENQWDTDARADRGAAIIDGISIAAKPCLSIPILNQPLSLVAAQYRAAHMGVQIHPLSDDSTDDTAQVMQDLYRSIERDSNAAQARWWAFDRAQKGGRGWYIVGTEYDQYSDNDFDQKIVINRILYQANVYMDPSATKPDFSDAGWAFYKSDIPFATFKRRWPKSRLAETAKEDESIGAKFDLESACAQTPEWANSGKGSVQVAMYWEKTYKTEEVKSPDGKQSRTREKCKLMLYYLAPGGDTGLDVIEEHLENGESIPLIPAYWSELQPFDDEHRYEGMVRPARDGAKLHNFMASEAVNAVGTLPKAPFIGDIEQFEPFINAWKQSAIRNMPFLPIKTVFVNGQMVPPPQRTQADSSILQPLMILLQQSKDFVQSTTSSPDAVLGHRNPKAESGSAIRALQGQSEAANSSGIQNFSDVTIRYEAICVLERMQRVYDRPGRIVHLLNREGELRPAMLNAPFVYKDKRPVRVPTPPPAAPGQTTTMQAPQVPNMKTYDLRKGFYGVSVTTGQSYNTQREQNVDQLGSIMEKDPELGVVLAPVFLRIRMGLE